MKLTNILFTQHNAWYFKLHWKVQGKRTIQETSAAKKLMKRGIVTRDATEYLGIKKEKPKEMDFITPYMPKDHKRFFFNDTNVLCYGITQAQVLLNTLTFGSLPAKIEEKIQRIKIPTPIERSMNQSMLVSHLLDAEQVKSYKRKLVRPDRPAFFQRRDHTITDTRMNTIFANRLIAHCERFHGLGSKHKILENLQFVLPLYTDAGKLIKFDLKTEFLIASNKPISPFDSPSSDAQLPNIHPLQPTISLPPLESDKAVDILYPLNSTKLCHPHTILLDYSNEYVKNQHEEPVTDTQFESRALIKAFTVAASKAKQLYGENVKNLSEPIAIQVVQLDGNRVQFGVFQLNTLDLNGEKGVHNFWFSRPITNLYGECTYNNGRPNLANYNFDILRTMCVLYGN